MVSNLNTKSGSTHLGAAKKKTSKWLKERPLGDALRHNYEAVLEEPLPKKLNDLLSKIRNEET